MLCSGFLFKYYTLIQKVNSQFENMSGFLILMSALSGFLILMSA